MSALGDLVRARVQGFVKYEPQPGVTYPEVLIVDDPLRARWRSVALGVGGSMLGLITYVVLAPWVMSGVVGLFWLAEGSPSTFLAWATQVTNTFSEPSGMVATQLGLATLIPISLALVLFVHRFHPRWLHSVQPGFRWRYGFVTLAAALLVLGAVWALSRIGQPWAVQPEPAFWGFVVAILLTSPLQAAAEEYFFRGYLLQAIHTTAPNSPWFGVVGSAAIFALMHGTQNLPAFLYRFVFGVLAGWLVVKTGGLEAGIAAHVANNVIAFGWAALSGTMVATRTTTTTTWLELAVSLAGFAAFAALAVVIAGRMKVATATPGVRFVATDEV
ncbi:MAG: CPBP family intramembrane metalloprotease [Propionicimonas sp.]|uniref:CPBP family intramembrane glutamic endopeptidase n=1 Tax=Propionicimonas sp. TaxID=1955623 RepID=UPI003D0CA375